MSEFSFYQWPRITLSVPSVFGRVRHPLPWVVPELYVACRSLYHGAMPQNSSDTFLHETRLVSCPHGSCGCLFRVRRSPTSDRPYVCNTRVLCPKAISGVLLRKFVLRYRASRPFRLLCVERRRCPTICECHTSEGFGVRGSPFSGHRRG